jgi:hypothetical protein
MTHTVRSARKKLRALIGEALDREAGLSDASKRRIVNRLLRKSDTLAEIGAALAGSVEKDEQRPVVIVPTPSAEPPRAQIFDPYSIGAVVTLQRHGAEGLRQRLESISSIENLVSLASAQNLALKSAGWSDAGELRAAIVHSAEQRLAERRAAAS